MPWSASTVVAADRDAAGATWAEGVGAGSGAAVPVTGVGGVPLADAASTRSGAEPVPEKATAPTSPSPRGPLRCCRSEGHNQAASTAASTLLASAIASSRGRELDWRASSIVASFRLAVAANAVSSRRRYTRYNHALPKKPGISSASVNSAAHRPHCTDSGGGGSASASPAASVSAAAATAAR